MPPSSRRLSERPVTGRAEQPALRAAGANRRRACRPERPATLRMAPEQLPPSRRLNDLPPCHGFLPDVIVEIYEPTQA